MNAWTPTLLLLALVACPKPPIAVVAPAVELAPVPPPVRANPLLTRSPRPYGLPPFNELTNADFRPGFETGMAEQAAEIAAIAGNPEPATFENTLVALERSGSTLTRVQKAFGTLNASFSSDELQLIDEEMAPRIAAHDDSIKMNAKLFTRIDRLFQAKDTLKLDPESAQLLTRTHATYVRAGAKLDPAGKAALTAINGELSTLSTSFEQHVRRVMKDNGVIVDTVAELEGLSQEAIGAAAVAATARGLEGKWLITLQNTTTQPVLSELTNRALRERIFRASTERALGGADDNTGIIVRMVELRAQKAKLLGYPTYAAYALDDETAKTPAAADEMLARLGAAALKKAKKEAADLQKIIDARAKASRIPRFELQPWDWAFYAEADRKARFDFDEAQVKPYFELDRVLRDGAFYSATALYGITFVESIGMTTYHPSVRVFEVFNADGTSVGMLLLDYFQRDNKQGGAWMEALVDQSHLLGQKPVIINNLNVPAPAPGQPVLLTFDEVTTLFHELGHGLHGLFADTNYPSLSGTATPPDFVEYPSQFNEMWASEPVVLANYAKHYHTGEAMPKALFDRVVAASNFGGGYGTLEYVQAARIDLAWHELGIGEAPKAEDVLAFEASVLKKSGMAFAPVPPRYHSPYFSHVFTIGYESAYYAYIWSEVLARGTGAWFHANGGLTRANGDLYRAKILSRGRTAEPSVLFADFYGKAPDVGPLLEYRGLGPK